MQKQEYYKNLFAVKNIADTLKKEKLDSIGQKVLAEYNNDKASRQSWEDNAKDVLVLAKMDPESKDFPFKDASNVKYPIITRAVIQFTANASAEIVRHDKTVGIAVIGDDPIGEKAARAHRVEDFMNYQLLLKNTKWQETMDRTLTLMGVVGTVFHRVWFDPVYGEECIELCAYDKVYIHNKVKSLQDARRITYLFTAHNNTILENINLGYYTDCRNELQLDNENMDASLVECVEQHRFLDLDGDGYEEPYIVTVKVDTGTVLRIAPRFQLKNIRWGSKGNIIAIKPDHYFVDFHCLPALDGSFYSVGFGSLLNTLNRSANTIINQLINAGTLATSQTGFISKGLGMKSGEFDLIPGKLHKVQTGIGANIANAIHMLQFKEPSSTLFELLGLIDSVSKELSTTTDVMTGAGEVQNVPATTQLSSVERGMKVYTAIQKRIFRSLTREFNLLFQLNQVYTDPNEYLTVLDDPKASMADFEGVSFDIKTTADPNLASDAQRMAQAQVAMGLITLPGINTAEVITLSLVASGFKPDQISKIIPPDMPNPAAQAAQQQAALEQMQMQIQQYHEETIRMQTQISAQKADFDAQLKQAKLEQADRKMQIDMAVKSHDAQHKDNQLAVQQYQTNVQAATAIGVAKIAADAKPDDRGGEPKSSK